MKDQSVWAFYTAGDRTSAFIVDEHGCLLNTEPVCVIESKWHPWFEVWLRQQPCDCPVMPALLWHPALGETRPSECLKSAQQIDSDLRAAVGAKPREDV